MIKVLKSLLVIVAVGSIAVGATGAYFTSEQTVAGMSFGTGTLAITDTSQQWMKHVSFSNLKPGDSIRKWVVFTNTGTLDVDTLTVTKSAVSDSSGLLSQIPVSIAASTPTSQQAIFTPNWTGGTTAAAWFNNSDILDTAYYRTGAGVIHPGETYTVIIDFTVPTTLPNTYQGATAGFDLIFHAEQSHTGQNYF
jgi:hypothetical protein